MLFATTMVSTTATMLSSIATPFHVSMRSKMRRHRRPRKNAFLHDGVSHEQVNGGDSHKTTNGAAASSDKVDTSSKILFCRDLARGPRVAVFLVATTICLLTSRKVLEFFNVVQVPGGLESGGGVGPNTSTSKRKKMRGGSGTDKDKDSKRDHIYETNAMGYHGNSTIMTLESDPFKPTLYQGQVVPIPSALINIADTSDPITERDLPLYWHIPRSGGATMKSIVSQCMGLTIASERGVIGAGKQQMLPQLMVVADDKGQKYVNVDTTSPFGIERAKALGLATFRPLDLVVSPYLQEAAGLFDSTNRGRLFALIRHPIERGASLYYRMLQDKKLQIELARFGLDTLEKYAKSDLAENNWLTRYLSGKINGELTVQDEAVAREVLRTKVLVGLLAKKEESFHRFIHFLGWTSALESQGDWGERCVERLLGWGWEGKVNHPRVKEGTSEWKALWDQNTFDVRLYEYAQDLYDLQGSMLWK